MLNAPHTRSAHRSLDNLWSRFPSGTRPFLPPPRRLSLKRRRPCPCLARPPQVLRWTRSQRLKAAGQPSECVLDLDRIIIPVHQGLHWVCAVIDLANRCFIYYDSMGVRSYDSRAGS